MFIFLDLWQFSYYFLIIILIGLVAFGVSLYTKKWRTLIIVMVVLIIGTVIFVNQLKYTTFSDLYSNQLNDDTIVESISINIYDLDYIPERKASVEILDEEIIEQILVDLSGLKLKRDYNIQNYGREYEVEIVVTNQVDERNLSKTTISLDMNENYVNEYQVISVTNHLRTIESLVESDEIEWRYYDRE